MLMSEDEDGEREQWGVYSLSKLLQNARKNMDEWYRRYSAKDKAREVAGAPIVLPSAEWWMNRVAMVGWGVRVGKGRKRYEWQAQLEPLIVQFNPI